MATSFNQLLAGSFRGESFLVISQTKEGGKKVVSHEYPNSNKRFCEELGKVPPKFTIEAVVHGKDALVNSNNLEIALETAGLGTLVHPLYGSLEVMVKSYSVSTNQNDEGVVRYSMTFEVSEMEMTLQESALTNAAVSAAASEARDALNAALGNAYKPPTLAQNISAIAGKVNGAINSVMSKARSAVGVVTDTVSAANQFVSNINAQVNTIVQLSSELQSTITDFYNTILTLCDTPNILIGVWNDLVDYGTSFFEDTETEKAINPSTVIRAEREEGRSLINEHTRLMALVNLYEAAAYNDFSTDSDLQLIKERLADSFSTIVDQKTDISSGVVSLADDPAVRSSLNNLRSTAGKVFELKEQSIWKIVSIEQKRTSALLVAFQYYGSIDNTDLITDLNKNINSSHIDTTISVVTE
jgi:prophage DNA circulation protein